MKRFLMVELVGAMLLAGCMVGPGPHGSGGIVVVPALPPLVVLEAEPYYQHGGYFYFYQNNSWSYSRSRSGPWVELPRDRYPKEVKFKGQGGEPRQGDQPGKGDERGRGDERGQGEKRGHDNR